MSTKKGKVGSKIVVPQETKSEFRTINDVISLLEPQTEERLLPSKGILYPFDRVRIRPLTSKEEKKIASITSKNFNKQINSILKSCIKEPENFDPLILTIGDRTSLIVWLRIITHGNEYVSSVTCPQCGSQSKEVYDLEQLEALWLPDEYKEPYFIEMDNGITVGLRLMRVKDDVEIDQILTQQRKVKNISSEDEWSYRFAKTITNIIINGEELQNINLLDKIRFFEALPGKESRKIREFHSKFDHGVDMRVPFECSSCGYEIDKLILNIEQSFFLPTQVNM